MKVYIWNLLISIDQLFNTLLGGYPDETLSSRMGKRIIQKNCKICIVVCWFLSFFEKDHCFKSIEKDEGVIDYDNGRNTGSGHSVSGE